MTREQMKLAHAAAIAALDDARRSIPAHRMTPAEATAAATAVLNSVAAEVGRAHGGCTSFGNIRFDVWDVAGGRVGQLSFGWDSSRGGVKAGHVLMTHLSGQMRQGWEALEDVILSPAVSIQPEDATPFALSASAREYYQPADLLVPLA